ncbi:FAD-dependent oxidoreductase [Frankia sp. QA3]|uniref:FAD-dependent oxidoreductase n=1 Tax=Frankia sp. QA3 TaxID=710111 RepID=UPI000269C3BF|nr:glycine/D-amino acid oxidase, deaminating [Frankia sp. QA3]
MRPGRLDPIRTHTRGEAGYTADMAMGQEVLVLGSGVSGMTTALCLAEAGAKVRIVTAEPYQRTTSALAGALWGPYVVNDPRVLEWSIRTLEEVRPLCSLDRTGVKFVHGGEATRVPMEPPEWLHQFDDFRLSSAAETPPGYIGSWTYSAPIFDMPVYLRYLDERLRSAAVQVTVLSQPLRSLQEVTPYAKIVVNCTGLGARILVPDETLRPSWGQLLVTENPGLTGFFSDYPEVDEPTYYIAHADHVILGGCVFGEHVDVATANAAAVKIRKRCSAIEPRLCGAKILASRSAFRPVRPEVRLDRTIVDETVIIHNYGHGGSGITLSWGCARSVQAML